MRLGWDRVSDRVIDESIDAKTQYVQTDFNKKLKPRQKTTSILKSISHGSKISIVWNPSYLDIL